MLVGGIRGWGGKGRGTANGWKWNPGGTADDALLASGTEVCDTMDVEAGQNVDDEEKRESSGARGRAEIGGAKVEGGRGR